MSNNTYTASNIKVLKGLEAVRKRPAMYIGGTSERGLHHLVYEVVDNSIDEALAGECDLIKVTITAAGNIEVDDNGRGIPVDIQKEMGVPALQVVLTVLHAGGKFDQNSYKVSGGLHGVGVSVVNALAEWLEARVLTGGKEYLMRFEKGIPVTKLQVIGDTKRQGTIITFRPDPTIFETTNFSFDYLATRFRELAFLNRGVRIVLKDERTDRVHDFKYEGGISSFVEYLNQNKKPISPKPIYVESIKEDMEFEVAVQYNEGYQENIYSFANNINTIEGGTHLSGFKRGLTTAVNTYIKNHDLLKNEKVNPSGDDIREGLTAVISIKMTNPQFEGQTKTKLQNSDVEGIVGSAVYEELTIFFEEIGRAHV